MKRIYELPKVKIVTVDEQDIVTASSVFTNDYTNDNEQKIYEGWWQE